MADINGDVVCADFDISEVAPGAESFGWDQAVAAGLVAVCPITELEFFYSARSAKDREETIGDLRAAFGWVPVHDGAYARAWEVQGDLTALGQHRSAGPVDLVVAPRHPRLQPRQNPSVTIQ
jgi:predicted nucleic acid-binding protein